MSQRIFLLILLSISFSESFSQGLNFQWEKTFESPSGFNEMRSVSGDNIKSIYTAGWFTEMVDFNETGIPKKVASNGGKDIFILRTDSSLGFKWMKGIGSIGDDEAASIVANSSGNIFVTGYFQHTVNFDPNAGTSTLSSNGGKDIFIMNIDSAGNLVWAKSIGGIGDDEANSIKLDASGNIYIAGYFNGSVDFDSGAGVSSLTSFGSKDMFLMKLDVSGNFLWVKQFGGQAEDVIKSISIDVLGNVYATGYFQDTASFDPPSLSNMLTASGGKDVFTLKVSPSGNFIWVKGYHGNSDEIGNGIAVSTTGGVVTCGEFEDTVDFDPGVAVINKSSLGDKDIFLVKLDTAGNFVWSYTSGATGTDYAADVKMNATGDIYVTGMYKDSVDFDPSASIFKLWTGGAYVAKYNTNGVYVWVKGFIKNAAVSPVIIDVPFHGIALQVMSNGSIFCTGTYQWAIKSIPGNAVYNPIYSPEMNGGYLNKFTSNGTTNNAGFCNLHCPSSRTVTSIQTDTSGNIYTVGTLNSKIDFDPSAAVQNMMVSGSEYVHNFISKHDANGNFLWAKDISLNGATYAMIDSSTGNIFSLGAFTGTIDVDMGSGIYNLNAPSGYVNFYLSKSDPSGDLLWVKQLNTTAPGSLNYFLLNSIALDHSGNILMVGNGSYSATGYNIDFNPGAGIDTINLLPYRGFLAKYNSNGDFIFLKNAGGAVNFVEVDNSNNIYLSGSFNSANVDFDPGLGIVNLTFCNYPSCYNFFLTKLDSNAIFNWAIPMNSGPTNGLIMSDDFEIDSQENIYLLMESNTNYNPMLPTGTLLVKLNSSGSLVWYKKLDNSATGIMEGKRIILKNNKLFVAGSFQFGPIDFNPDVNLVYNLFADFSPYVHNTLLACYDTSGTFVFAKNITPKNNKCTAMTIDRNMDMILAGVFSDTCDFDVNSTIHNEVSPGYENIFVEKFSICNTSTSAVIAQSACNTYNWNGVTYTTSGNYQTAITNASGCDSLITLMLTISNAPTSSSFTQSACQSYNFNGLTITVSGIYTDTLVNAVGCDSVIILNLTINPPTSSALNLTACQSYIFNGQTFSLSGIYIDTLVNSMGCDSIVSLNLTINPVDASASQTGNLLTANTAGASYQWVNCPSFSFIPGATNQLFTALANGDYSVIVTQSSCTDSSACMTVSGVGFAEQEFDLGFSIIPNPTTGILHIYPKKPFENASISLLDVSGKVLIKMEKFNGPSVNLDISHLAKAVYFIEVFENGRKVRSKIVRN